MRAKQSQGRSFDCPFFLIIMAIGRSKLHEMLRRGSRLSDLEAWFETFNPDVQRHILDWIRDDQLRNKNIKADGSPIENLQTGSTVYSELTEQITQGRKRAGDPYTLEDTGDFYRSMFIVVLRDAIEFNADPIKESDNLFEKYGNNILGLTDENKDKLKRLLKNNYIAYYRKTLFGTI